MQDFKAFNIIEYNKDLMDCNLYDSVNNCGNIMMPGTHDLLKLI